MFESFVILFFKSFFQVNEDVLRICIKVYFSFKKKYFCLIIKSASARTEFNLKLSYIPDITVRSKS